MNQTDIWSFFALVNLVSYAYALKEHLLPFREMLKKGAAFYWDSHLQSLFKKCRSHIADQVVQGIQTFSATRYTCLTTDWSSNRSTAPAPT